MSANDRQVGGGHYSAHGKKIQHWDLAVMFKWDPFQYQITKHVMRWKDKFSTPEQQLSDLKKAQHYLEKYIEEYTNYLPPQPVEEPETLGSGSRTVTSTLPQYQICPACGTLTNTHSSWCPLK